MKKTSNTICRHAFWLASCLGALLSTTALAQAHTRWLVVDSVQAEGDADVTEAADNVMDPQPEETRQLEDEFWSEALQNVEVSSALDTDEDIPTLTAEGSFILPTYILPEADVRKTAEKPAVVDESNPWRQDGVVVGEAEVIQTPTLEHVEEQYAQTEDLLAQTSTRLETIEARIRDLQEMNAQMAQATEEAIDAETERLSATQKVEEVAVADETPAPEPFIQEQPQAVVAQEAVEVAVATPSVDEAQVEAQKEQIEDTKEKIAKLQQTVEYAGLQVAYQDTTSLLNNTAKKLKGLENDLTQLKKTEADAQKAKLVEDQYQKTAELLSVTTAQLESVEKRMAELDAQEAELKTQQETQVVAQQTPAFDPYGRRERALEIQKQILEQEQPASAEEAALPTMKVAGATALQLQNAADALANATARLEALENRLAATPRETNLAVATPCPKKRPWLLPVEAIEDETAEAQANNTIVANIPAVKDTYVDRVLQAIDRAEKNRTSTTYADDVMLRTIPNEIKINFQPGRAELSAQALKWVKVFSASMKNRAQNAIEIRMGMQQLELQARRFALLKAALLNNGVSPRQIRFTLTNRDNDSVVLRVIPLVQEVDLQQRDTQTGQKVKQVVYQW